MPKKTIEYTVNSDRISPVTVQNGGVSGDENTVEVVFDVSGLSLESTNRIRIDAADGAGGFYSSENLTVNDGKVKFMLPRELTSAGGIAQLHLIVTKLENNKVSSIFHSYPARIRFESSPDVTEGYLHYEHGLSGLAAECEKYAGAAKEELTKFSDKLTEYKSDVKNQIDDMAGTLTDNLTNHNWDTSSHNDIRTNISTLHDTVDSRWDSFIDNTLDVQKKLNNLSTTMTTNLTNHNTDTSAHNDIRTNISILHDTVDNRWDSFIENKQDVQKKLNNLSSTMTTDLTNHNSNTSAHNDIRTSISTLHDTVDNRWDSFIESKIDTTKALAGKADYSTGSFTLTSVSDDSFTIDMEYIKIKSIVLIYGSFTVDDPSDLNMRYTGLPFSARARSGMASSALRFYANGDKLTIAANDTVSGTIYLTYLTTE